MLTSAQVQIPTIETELVDIPATELQGGSKPLQRLSRESAHGVFGVSPQSHLFLPEAPYDHLERCNESDKRRAEESERHWPANEYRRRGCRQWAWGDRRDGKAGRRVAL